MKAIKKNTKEYNNLLEQYKRYKERFYISVYDAYNRPSIYKVRAEDDIKKAMREQNGGCYYIWSYNTCFFSCSYEYTENNKTYLKIFTKSNIKLLEL